MKSKLPIIGLVYCSFALATPALAMDPACQPLMQSQRSMANTPVHISMTETETWSKNLSRAAASIGMGGTKKSEEISTGKGVYVRHGEKWIDMQMSFAEMAKMGDPNDPEVKKAREAKRCKALPDETVAGQPAAVYWEHAPSGIDTKIWISKIWIVKNLDCQYLDSPDPARTIFVYFSLSQISGVARSKFARTCGVMTIISSSEFSCLVLLTMAWFRMGTNPSPGRPLIDFISVCEISPATNAGSPSFKLMLPLYSRFEMTGTPLSDCPVSDRSCSSICKATLPSP